MARPGYKSRGMVEPRKSRAARGGGRHAGMVSDVGAACAELAAGLWRPVYKTHGAAKADGDGLLREDKLCPADELWGFIVGAGRGSCSL